MKTKLGFDIPDDFLAFIKPDDGVEQRLDLVAFFDRYLAHPQHTGDSDAKLPKKPSLK